MTVATDQSKSQNARRWYQSVATRLHLAFGLIAALTIAACLLAIVRFNDASAVVTRLTDVSLPAVKSSLVLENKAAAVSRAVAELARADSETQRQQFRNEATVAFTDFTGTLQQLKGTFGETESVQRISALAASMNQQIAALDGTIQEKIARATSRRASVDAVASATDVMISSLGPAGDAVIAVIKQAVEATTIDDDHLRTVIQQNLPTLQAVYDTRTDIVGVENVLNLASSAESPDQVAPLSAQFSALYRRVFSNLEVVIADSNADPARVDEMMATVRKLLAVGTGGNNLFDLRVQELNADAVARSHQDEMQRLSDDLNQEVASLVAAAENAATRTNALLTSEISASRLVLILIGAASILLSLLIGWLFIIRYVAHRMGELVESMLAVARGDLAATIPPVSPDELGDMSRALVVFRDNAREIREAKEAAENARAEAEAASRTKSTFLANMSHELRTPLNAIIGYSEMLLEDASDEGDTGTADDLRKIQNAGKHLLRLINDILDLSKIEAGRMEIYLETISVPTLVEEVRTLVTPLAATNQNSLEMVVDPAIGDFRTDITKLKQSLLNLVSNACKFTKNGTVALKVSHQSGPKGEELHFAVSDSGIGMTEEQIGKLFQPFVQADSSTTRQFGGTGLGLAVTKQFCRMLGGDVSVTSIPGNGSVFEIILPALAPEAARPAEKFAESAEMAGATTLLLVDDDAQIHDLLGAMLTRDGYRVLHASNGREAVARARGDRPAAILLDIMMPQIDGWTVLSELKNDPGLSSIPVIIVSMLDERPLGLSLGAAEFLTKPIERAKLVATIERYIVPSRGPALIVEDQEADRTFLTQALKAAGISVFAVGNGRAALEWLAKHDPPSAMILDIMMPELDGFAVLDAVRKDARLNMLPVIILTAKELTVGELEYLRGRGGVVIAKGPDARETVLSALRRTAA